MDRVTIKGGAKLRHVIVDKQNVIGENQTIGFDPEADRFHSHIDSSGIVIIPKGGIPVKVQRNKGLTRRQVS